MLRGIPTSVLETADCTDEHAWNVTTRVFIYMYTSHIYFVYCKRTDFRGRNILWVEFGGK